MILPLRYAAVPGDAAKSMPALPATLGDKVSDLVLDHARYAPRVLRHGYLYVLIKRAGVLYWEAYSVIDDAFLYKFPADTPPANIPEFSCDRSVCGVNASMISIDKVESVEKVYLLFTPSPMTVAKLKEYKSKADDKVAKGQMQVFDPKAWVGGSTAQKHSMKAEQLEQHVPEFMLYSLYEKAADSFLGKSIATHLFKPLSAAFAGLPAPAPDQPAPGRLGALKHKMKQTKAAAFVLHDHIGVTQELNDFRNAPLEGLQSYLAATDDYGASNEHRMQLYEAIEEVRVGFEQGIVNDMQEALDRHRESSAYLTNNRASTARTLRQMGRIAEAESLEKDIERSNKAREANYKRMIEESKQRGARQWADKYASRLDTAEMALFKKTLDQRSNAAFDTAEKRAADHLKWFEADRLVGAFDTFDPESQVMGYEFAIEAAICSFGLSGCKAGEEKIDGWVQATSIERKNLYMRGYYHNQEALYAAAKEAADAIRKEAGAVTSASEVPAATYIKALKGLVDGFKKTDSAFDEWARNQSKPFSQKWVQPSMLSKLGGKSHGLELIVFHKISEITRTVFRAGLGGKGDAILVARLSGLLFARMGSVCEKLRMEELLLKIDKSKLADGYKGRDADRNRELAERKAGGKASAQIKKELAPSLTDLVADAQEKSKLSITRADIVGKEQITNNYHQTRIGVVLGCIELIGLGEKMTHAKWDMKTALELSGSIMAVGSIVLDTYYSAAKSIREITPYKNINAIAKGGDIVRGGFKLGAGVLGAGAGFCGALLDLGKFRKEEDTILRRLYGIRAATGFVSAGLTLVAAFSYSENLMKHMARGYAEHQLRYRLYFKAGEYALKLAVRVRLLIWVARLNWIGLGLTAIEIGYILLKDDDLQNWCEKSVFRKEKKYTNWLGRSVVNVNFVNSKSEIEELEKGAQSIGVGGN
ncbi:hypothetical protein HF313_27470 [Massilia atriviolacea]|uniref:Toxin VasX N-terminal region domain-containing protein n=2 Tax=Massilia atriviolacea TaxID=2495579 RepID=A0A430HJE0_9BURK|nr:hypothetical protein EJB06_18325 [Massilia atriviolacea]